MGHLLHSCVEVRLPIELLFGVVSGVGPGIDVQNGGPHASMGRGKVDIFCNDSVTFCESSVTFCNDPQCFRNVTQCSVMLRQSSRIAEARCHEDKTMSSESQCKDVSNDVLSIWKYCQLFTNESDIFLLNNAPFTLIGGGTSRNLPKPPLPLAAR